MDNRVLTPVVLSNAGPHGGNGDLSELGVSAPRSAFALCSPQMMVRHLEIWCALCQCSDASHHFASSRAD